VYTRYRIYRVQPVVTYTQGIGYTGCREEKMDAA